jgi:iron complex outermembrane receptor protein
MSVISRLNTLSRTRLSVSLVALAFAELALPGLASAQTMPDPAPEKADTSQVSKLDDELVVTARSRKESLYDAPLSITSIGAAQIEDANLKDITNVAKISPGLFYTPQVTFSSSRLTPSIRFRGMSIPRSDPLEQLGGVFVDGVYLFGGAQSLTFDDIQRVEVVKGPQSALFGRGTFSGAVNFITREPSNTLAAHVNASVETHDSHEFNASIEGPILPNLTFRLSGSSLKRGGVYTTTDGGSLGREDTNVINAQLVWKPIDGLRFRVRHSEVWLDDGRNLTVDLDANRPALANAPDRCNPGPNKAIYYFCGALPDYGQLSQAAISTSTSLIPPMFARSTNPNLLIDILNNNHANPQVTASLPYITETPHLTHQGLAGRFYRTSGEAEYRMPDGITFNLNGSISRFAATTLNVTTDDAGFSTVISTNILTDKSVDFKVASSQEHKLTWLAGANYFTQKSVGGLAGTGAVASVVTPTPPSTTLVTTYTPPAVYSGQGEVGYYSAFFALGYKFFDWVSLDVEGRYSWDSETTSLGLPTATRSTYKYFTPRTILNFKPMKDLTVYGSWSRGALRGTTNSNFPLLSPAIQAQILAIPGFKTDVPIETIDSFEIGAKQILGAFRYTLAAYHMNWHNLKNTINIVCPNNICGPTVPGSFAPAVVTASAKISGLEAELDWRITSHWDAGLTAAYTHSRYGRISTPLALAATGQTDATGKTPVGFPSTQASFNTSYTTPVKLFGAEWTWFNRAEVNYTGKIYTDEIDQSWIKGNATVNLRIGIEGHGKRFEFYVENATNNKQWVSAVRGSTSSNVGFGSVSEPAAFSVLPRPRAFGARASYDF